MPLSYYKDMQEDKALAFDSYDTLLESIIITNELVKSLKPLTKERMFFYLMKDILPLQILLIILYKIIMLSFREHIKFQQN